MSSAEQRCTAAACASACAAHLCTEYIIISTLFLVSMARNRSRSPFHLQRHRRRIGLIDIRVCNYGARINRYTLFAPKILFRGICASETVVCVLRIRLMRVAAVKCECLLVWVNVNQPLFIVQLRRKNVKFRCRRLESLATASTELKLDHKSVDKI